MRVSQQPFCFVGDCSNLTAKKTLVQSREVTDHFSVCGLHVCDSFLHAVLINCLLFMTLGHDLRCERECEWMLVSIFDSLRDW